MSYSTFEINHRNSILKKKKIMQFFRLVFPPVNHHRRPILSRIVILNG
jgi:hypothetical protein